MPPELMRMVGLHVCWGVRYGVFKMKEKEDS